MTGIEAWSTTAASNNAAAPDGAPEGMLPSDVNNTMRQMMASVRTWYESAQWINLGNTPTYISAVSFSVTGDQTAIYTVGRRIRMVGTTPFTLYGTIITSVYGAVTTVTVVNDSGSLDATLSAVSLSIFTTSNIARPRISSDYALTTGSANAYVAAFTPKLAAHKTGYPLNLIANFSCTSSTTINPDGLGAIAIKKKGTTDTATGDIISGQALTLVYDGTYYQIQGANGVDGNTIGRQTLDVPAGFIKPSEDGGCATPITVATAANRPDITSCDFDATTQEYAQFAISLPKQWDEGTITAQFIWSHAATTTNFGVAWDIQAVATSNDDTINAPFGTAVVVTDTGGTTDDQYTSDESTAITIAGSPAAGDVVRVRVSRVTGNGADTMAIDARLEKILIYVNTDAGTDA